MQWVRPQAQELWAVFLSGGLLGLMLYRVWTMVLTSLLGTLVAGHAALLLLEPVFNFDAVVWSAANAAALNGSAVGLLILGILLQVVASPDDEAKPAEEPVVEEPEPVILEVKPRPWWKKLLGPRKAA